MEIGSILLMLLGLYYLLKTFKTQQYTKIWTILIYILLFFINGYTIGKIPTDGWEGLGLALLYILFTFGVGIYILLMNLISFIIKSIKKKKGNLLEEIIPTIKPLYKSLYKILMLVVVILVSNFYIKFDEYLYNKIETPYKTEVLQHLKNKYNNLEFEIYKNVDENEVECRNNKCYIPYLSYDVSSNLLKDKFYVYIDEQDIIVDNFIERYYNEITGDNPNKYFSNLLSNHFKNNNFNVSVKIDVSFKEEKATEINTLLKEEELLQLVQINDFRVIIKDSFNTNENFENYATELYKYYASYIGKYNQYKSLEYEFANPEQNNNIIFKNGGSIDKFRNEITVYYTDINH